jgi:O-6-methylguanine DNA methyltransferase
MAAQRIWDTPLGLMGGWAEDGHLLRLWFLEAGEAPLPQHASASADQSSVSALPADSGDAASADPGSIDVLDQTRLQLAEYFAGQRRQFSVPLRLSGTPFQQAVWEALRQIPFGQTRSYLEQARQLQQPLAIRAVAAANGQNPVAVLVPCHRVLGAGGKLTGYRGGLWRKKALLDLEQPTLF